MHKNYLILRVVEEREFTVRKIQSIILNLVFSISISNLEFKIQVRLLHCDALHDLVPFAHFKKREKCPWISATISKVAG